MANTKRFKISFGERNYQQLDRKELVQAQKNINETMKGVVREFKKNELISKQLASRVVLNS